MFRLELRPILEQTAKIPNAYEEAGKIVTLACAAPDLYEALELCRLVISHWLTFPEKHNHIDSQLAVMRAAEALLKANPQRKSNAQ